LPERVARADCIVVAKIIAVEEAEVIAPPSRDAPKKVRYRVAVLKVSEAVKGGKDRRTLRLGFPAPPEPGPGLGVRPAGPRFGTVFKVGQEGLFYLTRHFRQPFFTAPMYYDFVPRDHPGFGQEVDLARFALERGANLAAALDSRDPRERFYAAALLIHRYRTFRGGPGRTEPLGARESKQILTTLAEADWEQPGQITPWTLFLQLGLKEQDGWKFPATVRSATAYHAAAREWCRTHAATFRIRRIVGAEEARPGRAAGKSRGAVTKD
jgi:hypothetical protein